MKKQHVFVLVVLWTLLTGFAWFSPAKELSDSERRPLAQFPGVSLESVADGKFMKDFEKFSLDQFPLRDGFRTIKSLFHYHVLGQKDNNDIYVHDGYAAKQEYPLNVDSVNHALERFHHIHEKYLDGSKVYLTVVPDKSYYLAEKAGQLSLDYEALFDLMEKGMPWAEYIDLTGSLSLTDYYRTDTHWRQENLLPAAQTICDALGVTVPERIPATVLDRPFYGVYYGQAALPMEPDALAILEYDYLKSCTVYDHETGKTASVYDMTKLDSRDLYDVYLSGARALLTIENSNGKTDKELIVFRDSFGSSMVPLLIQDYSKVTLVDTRYISSDLLDQFIDFQGQDVLFLYSTLILNSSSAIK